MEKLEIEAVEAVPLRIPRTSAIPHRLSRESTPSQGGAGFSAVWVHTKGGPSGFGYSWGITSGATAEITSIIRDKLAPRMVGRDALAPEALWQHLFGSGRAMLRSGAGAWALSVVDIACWDVLAKAAGLPLHRLLGGYRSRVPVYGSAGGRGSSDADLLTELDRYRSQGCRAFKFHVGALGGGIEPHDESRVATVRKEAGDDFTLYVDANGGYTPTEAIEVAAMLRHYGVAWFEEPVPADSADDLAYVAAHSPVPIATGENVSLRWGYRELVSKRAASVLQADMGICGGITEFRKVAALAESFNLGLCNHIAHEIGVTLVGASPAGLAVEYADLLPHDIWATPNEVTDGHLTVPDVPGHGVELAADAKERYRVD